MFVIFISYRLCVYVCVYVPVCLSVSANICSSWWGCVSLRASVHSVHYTLQSLFHLLCVSFSITLRTGLVLFPLQINEVTSNHLRRLLNDDDELWQCIADQGDLKVYKRELEENGIVIDPVKAVCTVKVRAIDSGTIIDPVKAIRIVKVETWAPSLTLSKLFALWRFAR